EQRDEEARGGLRERPGRLAGRLGQPGQLFGASVGIRKFQCRQFILVDQYIGEVGAEDEGDDNGEEGLVGPVEQCPRYLPEAGGLRRWRAAPRGGRRRLAAYARHVVFLPPFIPGAPCGRRSRLASWRS